eukprot:SAG31_NODE_2651_length_5296_cov_2.101770_4_plen_148_part_00
MLCAAVLRDSGSINRISQTSKINFCNVASEIVVVASCTQPRTRDWWSIRQMHWTICPCTLMHRGFYLARARLNLIIVGIGYICVMPRRRGTYRTYRIASAAARPRGMRAPQSRYASRIHRSRSRDRAIRSGYLGASRAPAWNESWWP